MAPNAEMYLTIQYQNNSKMFAVNTALAVQMKCEQSSVVLIVYGQQTPASACEGFPSSPKFDVG